MADLPALAALVAPAARRWLLLAVAAAGAALLLFALPGGTPHAQACAFLRTPAAYEAEQARVTYLSTIDAASVDALFPGDAYFGLPAVEVGTRAARADGVRRVPAVLLKAIAWEESTLTMASRSTHFDSLGPALVSFDCGHGVMQVTTGMTAPLGTGSQPALRQVSVATHYVYNIARGAAILADKWNQAPKSRPIAGTDTASDPRLVENWYFAVWSYNGFAGPGSNSSNHPLDPSFGAWPRARYECDGTQSRRRYPYQELVWGCAASPPERLGALLWTPVAATLPDFTQPRFFQPLSLGNWAFPYSAMDIPTPQPAHASAVPQVPGGAGQQLLAVPRLRRGEDAVVIQLNGLPADQRATVTVENAGTGILSWVATSTENWIVVDPPAGAALGADVECRPPQCLRGAELTITVNPTLLPRANTLGILRIVSPNAPGSEWLLRVEVDADFEVAAPGTSRAY